jgi:CRISPR-associated endonuclease/helicase Cas3
MVIPLEDCVARPPREGNGSTNLLEHLLAVAQGCGCPDGDRADRLRFLAGLLHDIGKGREAWQRYILGIGKNHPDHSKIGAFLFSLVAVNLLEVWTAPASERLSLQHLSLQLAYDLYRHHGAMESFLGDLPPWWGAITSAELDDLDLRGVTALLVPYVPEIKEHLPWNTTTVGWFDEAQDKFRHQWPSWQKGFTLKVLRLCENNEQSEAAQHAHLCLDIVRENGRLIAADRLHAAGFTSLTSEKGEDTINRDQATSALCRLENFCKTRQHEAAEKGADDRLLQARAQCHRVALHGMQEALQERFYSLELPTGYGKTLTSLGAALTSIASGYAQRIIYVAPYLSILSQAQQEIRQAIGLEVVVRHHLSALEDSTAISNAEEALSDCWHAPIVATTYNQLFSALFPRKAQQSMRLEGLRKAFLILDEPQTVQPGSWNLLLAMLEAAAADLDCRILLTSATLPLTQNGLTYSQVSKLGKQEPVIERYTVQQIGELAQQELAQLAVDDCSKTGAVAVILNTIKDAALTYQCACQSSNRLKPYFICGQMSPLHKSSRIREISRALDENTQVLLISTQVLEAGVDLSFRSIYRARALLPSLVQAAGRCNRHGEGPLGTVQFVDFRRDGQMDTRHYVYRDNIQREVSDSCLPLSFGEMDANILLKSYAEGCDQRNTYQATLSALEKGAFGDWGFLAGITPFDEEDIYREGVFVPYLPPYVTENICVSMQQFGLDSAEQLWDRYIQRGFLASLDFPERRRFMALLGLFVVQLPQEMARKVGEPVEGRTILKLRYQEHYSTETGFALVNLQVPVSEQYV